MYLTFGYLGLDPLLSDQSLPSIVVKFVSITPQWPYMVTLSVPTCRPKLRLCMLNGGTQRYALSSQNVEMEIICSSKWESNPKCFYSLVICCCFCWATKALILFIMTSLFSIYLYSLFYLFTFVFSFLRSGVEDKRGVEFCHSTRNPSRIRQKMGNRMS